MYACYKNKTRLVFLSRLLLALTFDMFVLPDLLHDGVPLRLVCDPQVVFERLLVNDVVTEEVEVIIPNKSMYSFFLNKLLYINSDGESFLPVVDKAGLVLVHINRAQPLSNRLRLPLSPHRGVFHRGQGSWNGYKSLKSHITLNVCASLCTHSCLALCCP